MACSAITNSTHSLCSILIAASVAAAALGACIGDGDAPRHEEQHAVASVGVVVLPLEFSAESGTLYRLEGEFFIHGATERVLIADEHSDEAELIQVLPTGSYTVTLQPGWQLLRQTDDGYLPALGATLVSPGTQGFSIEEAQVTDVVFAFEVNGEPASTGGALRLSASVEEYPSGDGNSGVNCPDGQHVVSSNACKPVLFSDDFEDGSPASDWLLWRMTFEEIDGHMSIGDAPRTGFDYGHWGNGRDAVMVTHVGDEDWADYRVDLDAYSSGPGSFNPYGLESCYRSIAILLRTAEAHESWNQDWAGYEIVINPLDPGLDSCMDHQSGWVRFIATRGYFEGTGCCDWGPGRVERAFVDMTTDATVLGANHYTVELVGNTTTLWINGVYVFEYVEDSVEFGEPLSTYGGIGIKWTWEQEGWVDNVVVTDLR